MEVSGGECRPTFDDREDFLRAREVFQRADYTHERVLALFGNREIKITLEDLPPLLRLTRGGTPLETLARLFVLGAGTDVAAARRALAPVPLEGWVAAGLLAVQGDQVMARTKLVPIKGFLFAFDPPPALAPGREDLVMGVGASSLTLANLTLRRPVQSTLDLGTGCGVQAFFAAAHSARVIAVDRNPRAVHFASFNTRLNGLDNVECVAGDRFAPVEERRFGLIVTNPPFVVSPAARYAYRDAGLRSDLFCQQIARAVPQYLDEGGYCHMLCNWVHLIGRDWRARLTEWFAGSGCDVVVLRSETADPSTYALTWIRRTEHGPDVGEANLYDEWMAYYEQEHIEAISGGLITMRRRSGTSNWIRVDESPPRMLGSCGEDLASSFERRDFLERTGDGALLDAALRVSPDTRLEQQAAPSGEGWRTVASQLSLARGLAYTGSTDPISAALVGRCDGRHPLRGLVADIAATFGEDVDGVATACLPMVRELLERGFLLPPEAQC